MGKQQSGNKLWVALSPQALRTLMAEGRIGASDVYIQNAEQRQQLMRWCLDNLREQIR